jgi:fatty acid-binding protein DegV
MKKIAILVDSFSGIKNGQYKDVYVIPMVISETVDKQTYTFKDGIDIDNKQISLKMINGSIIKTASSIPGDIVQLIERISSQYDEIYCFPIPQCISGSYNSWVMALEICDLKKTHLFKQNLACACLE